MLRRTCTCSQQLYLFFNKTHQTFLIQQCFSLLEQECFISTSTSLSYKYHVVLTALHGLGLELPRQVCLSVQLLIHVDGCHLGLAQVSVCVSVLHPSGDVFLIFTVGQNQVAFFAYTYCSACVLA